MTIEHGIESRQSLGEVVVASLMRHDGGTGVQTHVQTFERYLRAQSRPTRFVNPFSARSPLLPAVFGARHGIQLLSRPASVWWYRHWHAHYLQRALARCIATTGDRAVVYAHCPVSADVALRVRTSQPVTMAVHFNVSQADEWVGKGTIADGGALFESIRAFEDRVLVQLDGIVYVSAFAKAILQERIPTLATIPSVIVPNPVSMGSVTSSDEIADLITVGSLESRKNHAYLLEILHEAARRGYRYSLSVVGDGPERGALQALSRRLSLDGRVRFYGYRSDARSLMGGHRLYCHTSRMENCPVVLIEAMAEGLPVLTAGVGGIPEVIRPGIDGAFWPLDDPSAAADALIALMEDPPKRAMMASAVREHVARDFSADVVGEKLVDFLMAAEIRR
jgi:glycosyltransferase involved in cell wall biosynthesis